MYFITCPLYLQPTNAHMPLNEFKLIRRIQQQRSPESDHVLIGIGDDTAAVRPTPGMASLVTTDTFVEGLDFDLAFSTWLQIGWKSMAANISDIAAMGGQPRYALTTLCLPDHRTATEIDALYEGMDGLIKQLDLPISIIGGDLSGITGPTVISITLMGEAAPERMLRRSGALVGDRICVTGHLGASEAGLRLLQQTRPPADHTLLKRYEGTVEKHRTPVPRAQEARLLADSGYVSAMIDISDGLSSDLLHIGRSSHVGLSLDVEALPITAETHAAARTLHADPVKLAMQSGEEFELLCTIEPDQVEPLAARLADQTGIALTPIGEVVAESEGFSWYDTAGRHLLIPEGYEHFKKVGV